jgi:hypothetical protein
MATTPPGPLARTNYLSWPPGSYQADADRNNPAFNPASVLASSGVVTDGNAVLDTEQYRRPLERLHGSGQAIEGAEGAVKVRTTRGKLSARDGVVTLAEGHGTITLTSACETVDQVSATASALDQPYASALLNLEFV